MRPFRSFLLLLIFLICFTGLAFLLHPILNFPNPWSLVPKVLSGYLTKDESGDTTRPVVAFKNSVPGLLPENSSMADPGTTDSLQQFSFNPLKQVLDSIAYSKGQVRIMYYGDSQIEGDRVVSFLRHELRKDCNGTGPGLFLPVMPVTYTKSLYIRSSSNWKRYNYLSYKTGEINHNDLGPFLAFCRYLPDGEISPNSVKSWIRIVPSKLADSSSATYDRLRIFYRNRQGNVKIEVKAGNMPVVTDTLRENHAVQEFTCNLYNSKNILIDFSGKVSPDIYGISIESSDGLVIDNIPQRGSAGLEFTMVDPENLKELYRLLSPDLIILHYGLNIVRNVRDDYSYYEKGLSRQLSLLKEVSPGSRFMLVGLTDMAYEEDNVIKSYPNIPRIIKAQDAAASATGAVFWDAHKAMGGKSSIIRWFNMNPALAKKDYVHLTDLGADTLAKLMYSELFLQGENEIKAASATVSAAINVPVSGVLPETDQQTVKEGRNLIAALGSTIIKYNKDEPFIFTTPVFWIFFLIVLAIYSLLYKRLFLRNLYLFIISLYFYYKTGGLFLILLIIVTLIDYTCAWLIAGAGTKFRKRLFLLASVISNIGILSYFKYSEFFIQMLNSTLGTNFRVHDFVSAFTNAYMGTNLDISNVILPIGISFFTFQSLSYTIDVYRNKIGPVKNIIDFGFYVSFFPQLVAGPIVRASEFIPQLHNKFQITQREFSHAVFLISKGLIKKIIISDFIAVNFVDRVFDIPTLYSGFENLMAVYGYGLQIYCDFSGYTDIAIGLALILGFRLPVNFNSPYKASSVADFWKRWHISLSRWLKDYLYIPLGGNRKSRFRTIVNVMITMLLGGLWHGANMRFIIWGGLHGVGLVINKIWTYFTGDRTTGKWWIRAVSVFLTFQFVSFCWIFFRAHDMNGVVLMLRQIFEDFLPAANSNILAAYGEVFSLMAAGYLIHFLPERIKEYYRGVFIKIPLAAQFVIVLLITVMLFQMRSTEILPFIYFRF